MNQLDQLVADINRRNLGLGHSSLFKPIWRRVRRFGGGLFLGDERAGEEEEGEGVLYVR
jgi:hypothetical protein